MTRCESDAQRRAVVGDQRVQLAAQPTSLAADRLAPPLLGGTRAISVQLDDRAVQAEHVQLLALVHVNLARSSDTAEPHARTGHRSVALATMPRRLATPLWQITPLL